MLLEVERLADHAGPGEDFLHIGLVDANGNAPGIVRHGHGNLVHTHVRQSIVGKFQPAENQQQQYRCGEGEFDEGKALFDGDKPSEETQQVMQFCERFEQAGQRTQAMMQELKDADILMDGEVSINQDNRPDAQPYVYRGFKMVDQEKLQNLPTETVEKWHKSGLLVLIHAHLMSLDMMRIIFARQTRQGKTPNAPQPANGELQVDI